MAEHNTDPFHWWRDHKKQFPILSELAQRFLIIPATSVPSEWLFSDVMMAPKLPILIAKIEMPKLVFHSSQN